jgi:DNA repair protein SbcC/Rad50
MLLKKIRLQNIRSYVDETISFNEGSSLLSGDIGCGKSSILLAVEFVLFGTSRPDLPAELLLRKGANVGIVELEFMIDGHEIKITRTIKEDKRSIKQLPGSLVIDEVKRDLMPIELKAEVIRLLGYPEDLLSKNKNYIFRYTVYTPQEEMKFILQENEDVRLDVLRKIFNIDKYKVIRENVLIFCKKLRGEIAEFKIRVEPLSEFKEKLKLFEEDKKKLELQLSDVEPKLIKVGEEKMLAEEKVKNLESKQQILVQRKEQLNSFNNLLLSKNVQAEQLDLKLSQLNESVLVFDDSSISKDSLSLQIKSLEIEKHNFLEEKTIWQQRINHLHDLMKREKEETDLLEKSISEVELKEVKVVELQLEIAKKSELQKVQGEITLSLDTINAQITTHNLTLNQSKDICAKITDLDNCPFCLQIVDGGHKQQIMEQEGGKINQAQGLLQGLEQQKKQLMELLENGIKRIDNIFDLEKILMQISTELSLLKEKKESLVKKKNQLRGYVLENNEMMPKLGEYTEEKFLSIGQSLKGKQEELNLLIKREVVLQHVNDLRKQKEIVKEEVEENMRKIAELNLFIGEQKDYSDEILLLKKQLHHTLEQERIISMQKVEIDTKVNHVVEQVKDVTVKIKQLNEYERKLIKLKETHHWLMDFFVKLTYTIEKHVMGNIHYLFNDFFKQWFAILIDDDGLQARIDDTFSPVLEQNGYEINFGNLSGGEKTSAALAYRLALNRVINDVVHQIKTKSILILDEPTDGFSSEQLDKVRDVLDRLGLRQTIIVSHETKIESFVENIIRIGKEDHRSYVMG